jgi:pantoate--beta-alanine ligase
MDVHLACATLHVPLVTTRQALRESVAAARQLGHRIGLVPTMGALHAGHLSLVERCRCECGYVVVSIFVNPTQFGPNEDFARYPRDLEGDMAKLASAGVDLVYAPPVEEMYPPGFATFVAPEGPALPWEGACRPGHFRGVATVVLKLLMQAAPDTVYFGQKDFQQTVVVRRMMRDLDLDVHMVVCPTVREADGLALSSRNQYLSAEHRQQALALSRSLRRAEELVAAGQCDADAIREEMLAILQSQPDVRVEYVAIVDPETLQSVQRVAPRAVALVAAFVGGTRLIDNTLLLAADALQPPAT